MRAIGIFFLFLAGMLLLSALIGADHLDPSTVRGGVEGLRDYQQMTIILAVGLFLGGVVLFTRK